MSAPVLPGSPSQLPTTAKVSILSPAVDARNASGGGGVRGRLSGKRFRVRGANRSEPVPLGRPAETARTNYLGRSSMRGKFPVADWGAWRWLVVALTALGGAAVVETHWRADPDAAIA